MIRLKRLARLLGDERGQMGIMMIPTILIVCMFFALGLDAGLWYFDHRTAQTQAEASALAAVDELPDTAAATARADNWLTRNGSSPAERTCLSYSDRSGDGEVDTARVCVRRTSPSIFGLMSQIPFIYVSAAATATVREEPSLYALMAMNETECDTLYLHGGPIVDITGGGGTYTRSTCGEALHIQGDSELHAGLNDTVSGDADVGNSAELDPAASGQDWLPDPYADLPQPQPTGPCVLTNGASNINNPRPLSPGRYCYELRVNAPVTLSPGVYVLERGLRVTGNGRMTGDQVLLYNTCPTSPCGPAATPSDIEFQGGAELTLEGRDDYDRMVLWVDRTARPSPLIRFRGNSAGGLSGRIYNIQGLVDIGGTPGVTLTLNMSVVADHIELQGNADFDIPYDPALAPPIRTIALID